MGSLDTVPEEEITNPKKGTSLKNEFLMTPRVQGVRIRWARCHEKENYVIGKEAQRSPWKLLNKHKTSSNLPILISSFSSLNWLPVHSLGIFDLAPPFSTFIFIKMRFGYYFYLYKNYSAATFCSKRKNAHTKVVPLDSPAFNSLPSGKREQNFCAFERSCFVFCLLSTIDV